MKAFNRDYLKMGIFGAAMAALLAISLACGADDTPTPAPVIAAPTTAPAVQAQYGGTLRFAQNVGRIDTLDSAFTADPGSYVASLALYDGLMDVDGDGNLLPALAESWEFSADGKVVTFNLRQGVKFHDGTEFDAQAAKWHFDRLMDPDTISPRSGDLASVQRAEAVDKYTLRIHLDAAYRPLLAVLATERAGWLVSPTAVEEHGEDFGRKPVGAGPFKIREWRHDQFVILDRFEDYYQDGFPYLDTIRIIHAGDVGALAMFRTGEVDLVGGVPNKDVYLIEENPDFTLVVQRGQGTDGLYLNPSKPPFDNKALRQALSWALDRELINKVVYDGRAEPAYNLIPAGFAHNPNHRPIYYDPDKARALLKEVGYEPGTSIPLAYRGSGSYSLQAETFQAMWKAVGIDVELVLLASSGFIGPQKTGAMQQVGFKITGRSQRGDPHIRIHSDYHSKGYHNGGIPDEPRYVNPELDRLIDRAGAEYDTAKAKALYEQVMDIIIGDALWIATNWRVRFTALHQDVQGFLVRPDTRERLAELWFDRR